MNNRNDCQFSARKIRERYVEQKTTELDELRALDREVNRPANIFGYTFGTVGALVLGTGMSLAMGVLGDAMIPGIIIGCVGIAMVSTTYTLYGKLVRSRRAKYADRIVALSDKILEE